MRVLVVGGSGFLGSHSCDILVENNHKVIIYDKIDSPWKNKKQEMIVGDIFDYDKLNELFKRVDVVFNFAAISDLDVAIEQPYETANTNILNVVKLLELSVKHNIKKFVQASSVYASSNLGGFYSISKKSAEMFIKAFHSKYNLNYVILRFGSLYGPRSNDNNGLYKIVLNAIKNNKIIYSGNEDAIREYIHVYDAALAVLESLKDKFDLQTVVITGNNSTKVSNVLKILKETLNFKSDIQYMNAKNNFHYSMTPYSYENNISKKYIPNMCVDFGQGLLQLIEYVKTREDTKKK